MTSSRAGPRADRQLEAVAGSLGGCRHVTLSQGLIGQVQILAPPLWGERTIWLTGLWKGNEEVGCCYHKKKKGMVSLRKPRCLLLSCRRNKSMRKLEGNVGLLLNPTSWRSGNQTQRGVWGPWLFPGKAGPQIWAGSLTLSSTSHPLSVDKERNRVAVKSLGLLIIPSRCISICLFLERLYFTTSVLHKRG